MDTPQSGQLSEGHRFLLREGAGLSGGSGLSFLVRAFAVMVLLCVLPIDCLHAQDNRKPRDVLFGVHLSREARSLLGDVERLFGMQVREEWLEETDGMDGKSKVGDDGTPIIRIDPAHGRTLDVIVHELYHLEF